MNREAPSNASTGDRAQPHPALMTLFRLAGPRIENWLAWMPLCVLPLLVTALRARLPAWGFMWALALALFAGFKWLTWRRARATGIEASLERSLAYLLLWPGMDAEAFLNSRRRPSPPTLLAWFIAATQTLLGAFLLWGAARAIPDRFDLLKGWVGLAGLGFILHFGTFQLIALFWQRVGVDARPIMDSPLLASSIGGFWGSRWNSAFRDLSHRLVFQPVRGRIDSRAAVLVAFLASGVVHELVISVPAGSGFGLPTAYFLIQGLGVLVERSKLQKRLGLSIRPIGWIFTMVCAAGPACWLFHPAFITRVAIPFLAAIGAL